VNKKDLVMLMMAKKTLDYQKDPNPENWVTISGAKVHLDEGGKIDGGAKGKFNGKSYSGTKKQTHAGKQTETKPAEPKNYGEMANEAVNEWFSNARSSDPDFKNIKNAVAGVRSNYEALVRRAEKHLNEAKKNGNKEEIEAYKTQYEDAKGTLEELNKRYAGVTGNKEETKTPEVGEKGMAFLKRMSVIHSSFDESTGYMARDVAQQLKDGKSLKEIKDYFYGNIEKWGSNKEQERKEVDHFIEAVKRADKGLGPWGKGEAKEPKLGAPKSAGKEERDFIGIKAESKTGETIKVTPSNKRKIEEDLIDDYYLMKYADKISDGINKKNWENGKKDIKYVVDYRPTSIDVKGVKKVQDEVYGDDVAEVTYVVELEDHSVGHSGKKIRKTITQRMENLPPYKEDFYFG
jgi:hypothetical protein